MQKRVVIGICLNCDEIVQKKVIFLSFRTLFCCNKIIKLDDIFQKKSKYIYSGQLNLFTVQLKKRPTILEESETANNLYKRPQKKAQLILILFHFVRSLSIFEYNNESPSQVQIIQKTKQNNKTKKIYFKTENFLRTVRCRLKDIIH